MSKTISNLKSQTLVMLLAALFAFANTGAIAQTEQPESPRKQAPLPGPVRPFNLPPAQMTRLDNGLALVMIEDHRAPMVTIEAGIPAKTALLPSMKLTGERSALAEATAQLITEGAGNRGSEQLAREIETLGGRINSEVTDDYVEVNVAVVAENAEPMMEILGDVLLRPTFPQSEVALYKSNRIDKLKLDRQQPEYLLSEHFNRIVYGAHPYAISSPTPAAINAMTRAKIALFHRLIYTPEGSVVVIAGDFDPVKMGAKARAIFGEWRGPAKPSADRLIRYASTRTGRRIYLIDRPGSAQADFRIGGLAVNRSSPDYFPLVVANAILGSERAGSRLFLNIREQKGYAYDVYSVVSALKKGGTFFGGSQARNAVTLPAIKEMLAEFDRMRNETVSAEELQNAKNYLNGSFSIVVSTQGGIAGGIAQTYMLGLGSDYLARYRARIEAVTAEQVRQAARKYMNRDGAVIVVVGDAATLKKSLSTFGPVTVLDAAGRLKK
ncbi:MAG TPA: pitrilysin family protein [Blastocatellia bacterium]